MKQSILESKQALVQEISTKFKDASSSVVVEYRGLTVAEVTELRRKLREENIDFKVYKNSMVQRAAKENGYDELMENLTGPNAIAFSDDAVAPSRVLAQFARAHEHLVLKAGVVDGKVVNADELKKLSKLPNKEGMISMFLSTLQSPIRSFALAIKAVAESKEAAEAK